MADAKMTKDELKRHFTGMWRLAAATQNGVPHPDRPDMRALANPVKLDGERMKGRHAPKLGQDTEAVLREVGYNAAEIQMLRDLKAV